MSDVYLRKSKHIKRSKSHISLRFALLYFMFGGLALICCGVASKVFSNFIDFSKKESNTLKVFSLLHYFIGGAALMEGSVGLAWMTFKQRPLFNHAKRLHIAWSSIFFIAASANTIIFQTEMNHREPDHLMLTPKKATSLEWKAVQSLFQCCGYNSYADWLRKNSTFIFRENIIPLECCVVENGNVMGKDLDEIRCLEEAKRTPKKPNFIHVKGCKENIKSMINALGATTTILCFGFSVFQLLSLILTNKIKIKRPSDSDVLEE